MSKKEPYKFYFAKYNNGLFTHELCISRRHYSSACLDIGKPLILKTNKLLKLICDLDGSRTYDTDGAEDDLLIYYSSTNLYHPGENRALESFRLI